MIIKPLRGVFTPNQRFVYLRCHFGNGSIHLERARRVQQRSAQPGLDDAAGLPIEKSRDSQTSLKPDLEIPARKRQPTSISGRTKDASSVKKPKQLRIRAVQSKLKSNLPTQRKQTAKIKKPVEVKKRDSDKTTEDLNSISHHVTKTTETMVVGSLRAKDLKISIIPNNRITVPGLSYGLDRVLFNPGVYSLQDLRSGVFNFDPYLQTIMPVKEFNFNALSQFTTSSKDEILKKLAEAYGKRYVGSSSSMTGVLSHLHYLLSEWREINTTMLSTGFKEAQEVKSFTALNKVPSSVFLRWRDGTYAIDSDREFDSGHILMWLGMSMEKLLTLDTKDFERYRKSNPDQWPTKPTPGGAYHYSSMGNLLMRSQLDAYDARLPGTGMFDLKTRSVVSIRMDVNNYELGAGYQIKSNQGDWESYEREYFDMIRSAFLKYSLQVRMGKMDGIFVAYHNVEKIFGFQYISLPELDQALHGSTGDSTSNTRIGDQEFKMSLDLFSKMLDEATKKYPETSLRIYFETRGEKTGCSFMYVYAEPMTEAQVEEIQSKTLAEFEEFERGIHLTARAPSKEHEQDKEVHRADIEASVQAAMIKEKLSPPGAIMDPESSFVIANNTNFDLSHKRKDNETLDRENFVKHRDDENLTVSSSVGDGHVNPWDGAGNVEARKDNDENVVEEASEEEFDREMDGDEAKENAGEDADRDTDEDETNRNNKGSEELSEIQAGEEHGVVSKIVGLDNVGCGQIGPIDEESQQSLTDDDTNGSSTEVNNLDGREVSKQSDMIGAKVAGARDDPLHVPGEVLAMTLRLRNKVDGEYIVRPLELTKEADWTIEFSLTEETKARRAWKLYEACKQRKRKGLERFELSRVAERPSPYIENLRSMSKKGAAWSKMMDKRDKGQPRVVLEPDVAVQQRALSEGRRG